MVAARILDRQRLYLALGIQDRVGPIVAAVRRADVRMLDRSRKLPSSHSIVRSNRSAGASAACDRAVNGFLPKEEILLLIRCRCSNRCLLAKPKVGVEWKLDLDCGLSLGGQAERAR